jgi:hypothetical protein
MSLKSSGQPIFPTLQPADVEPEPEEATHEAGPNDAAAEGTASYVEEPPAPPQPIAWREVPVESHQPIDPLSSSGPDDDSDWARLLDRIKNAPDSEEEEAAAATPDALPTAALAESRDSPSTRNVIFGGEPALQFEDQEEGPAQPPKARSRSDTAMRLAVGFGAAGCVILAALLYEGGYLLKSHPTAGTSATAVVSPSARISPSAKASNRATASPSASHPVGTVLYSLGDGVTGNSVFRIRPGTAVSSYTRLVFDMRGTGLPSMVVSQLDPSRVQVLFKNTTLSNVPVAGISSTHIAAVEPGVQSGADASFVIDLARPVRVTAFTLPATGGYAWRLVVDLHTI